MAVLAGFNSTQLNDTVLPSGIAKFVVPTPISSPLYQVLAMVVDNSTLGSNVCDIPQWGAFPTVNTTPEGDESVHSNYPTNKTSMTGVMLDTNALITDQIVMDSMVMESQMVNQMVINLRNEIDKQVLGLFDGATNTSDNTGVNLTLALWRQARAAFRAQKPIGTMCFVGSPNQLRDIIEDMAVVAGGTQLGNAGQTIFSSSVIDGYLGPYQGVHIFESANVPEADASNDVGGFVAVTSSGPTSPPSLSGFALGIWQPIQIEDIRAPSRHGLDTTVSARVGFVRAAEYLVRAVISKKAA